MLLGFVFSAIAAGFVGFVTSALAGHPILMSFVFYSLSGCLGILAFALHQMDDRADRS